MSDHIIGSLDISRKEPLLLPLNRKWLSGLLNQDATWIFSQLFYHFHLSNILSRQM